MRHSHDHLTDYLVVVTHVNLLLFFLDTFSLEAHSLAGYSSASRNYEATTCLCTIRHSARKVSSVTDLI